MVPQPREWRPAAGEVAVNPAKAVYAIRPDAALGREGYELTIAADGSIRATAPTATGLGWARQTVEQLARAGKVPAGTVRDWPKYRVRGMMLDVGRKFVRMETLRKMLRDLAFYKINVFHIHLNDDGQPGFMDEKEGYSAFRLECATCPELTAKDGHYTKAEFRAFMKEASALGVTVIPEIDTPAHSGAIIRCRPEFEGRYGRTHLALDKPEVRDFIEKVFAEYLDGSDPVFAGRYVHVGTDEYDPREAENFRAYTDWIFRMVRRHGHEPAAWGALDHAAGRTPVVADKDIVMDIWFNGFYDPLKALEAGYSIVAVTGYVIPAAGLYGDYLDLGSIYDDWEPYVIEDKKVAWDDPRLLGGKFAIWNDMTGNGISEDDIADRLLYEIPTIAEKMWTGKVEGFDFDTFKAMADAIGEAPGVNLADRPTGPNGTPGPGDEAIGWSTGAWRVEFDLTLGEATRDVVLFDDGTSQVKVFAGGHFGFSRDGYDWRSQTALAAGKTHRLVLEGDAAGVWLEVDGVRTDDTRNVMHRGKDCFGRMRDFRVMRTLHFPLKCIAPKGTVVAGFSAKGVKRPFRVSDIASGVWRDLLGEVRPGGEEGRPFWNGNARMFLYPPTLEFRADPDAQRYRYEIVDAKGAVRVVVGTNAWVSLKEVWGALPTGWTTVQCQRIDAGGEVLLVGARCFWKQEPFTGLYPAPTCSYRTCAEKAKGWLFGQPEFQKFLSSTNGATCGYWGMTYPSKMIAALIRALVAGEPSARDLAAARTCAEWILSIAEPEGRPLAAFTPTYFKTERGYEAASQQYRGQTMLIYPASVGGALLALYEKTREARYLAHAKAMAETYLKLQGEDGTWPLKMEEATGKAIGPNRLMPIASVIPFLESLYGVTGDVRYRAAADRAFRYVEEGPVKTWNWEGQFEDVKPGVPYRNLTKHDACATAIYVLKRFPGDARYVKLAREILRFAEDQFVCWEKPFPDMPYQDSLQKVGDWRVPGVLEQYHWYVPIDASASKLIRTYLALYRAEGRPLDCAKACALGDRLTREQQPDGKIPTHWCGTDVSFWWNCLLSDVDALIELETATR